MIRVQCPHCQRRYRTEIEAFGRTAVCTKCSQTFSIGDSRPPFQWKATDLGEDSWIGVPAPEDKKEMKHCIICDAPLRPDTVRCPECGASQVTGLVHRVRRTEAAEKPSFLSFLPVRLILILLAVAGAGGGIYWGVKSIARQGVQLGDELADTGLAARAAKELERGDDEREVARNYAGYVKDANLDRFVAMLGAESPVRRRAAVLLIAHGQITRLEPLLLAAQGKDEKTAAAALATLEAMGPRRLVELSSCEDESIRRCAGDGLALLFDLDRKDPRVTQLAGTISVERKIHLLNEMCRLYPELIGPFVVNINQTRSPFQVTVEQVGRTFYLKTPRDEFMTGRSQGQFIIPIHRWCAATGEAVDSRGVRDLLSGTVTLTARSGGLWAGEVELVGRRRVSGPLPGFLPLQAPEIGAAARVPLRLERPARRG